MANAIIKTLKRLIGGEAIYPITKSNAVYDDTVGRLDTYLHNTIGIEEVSDETVDDDVPLDADTLGGKYKASDINIIHDMAVNNKFAISELEGNITDMTAPIKTLSVTLVAGSWITTNVTYYEIIDDIIKQSSRFIVRMDTNVVTKAQVNAMAEAMTIVQQSASNTLAICAYGTKPTINIPIKIDCYKM